MLFYVILFLKSDKVDIIVNVLILKYTFNNLNRRI